MNVKRITPVLFVKEIELVLPFWVGKLGFTKTIEVPHGNKIGFVALRKGSTEVMYQSYESLEQDQTATSAVKFARLLALLRATVGETSC